jgi:Methyltransferase domain
MPEDPDRVWRSDHQRGVLSDYFEAHTTGRGLWKWTHYYDIYERHLTKFVGGEVTIVEIGVYSGGSLDMWREYFGPRCHIHGVDIAEACRAYASDQVSIWIGDQADPDFWRGFVSEVATIDVVIDDGGHQVDQQVATLEALLPHLSRGGVYVCEDVAGVHNPFHAYLAGLTRNLDAWNAPDRLESRTVPTEFQRAIASIHRYPYLVVIERAADPPEEFACPRRGTEWQPF